MGGDLFVMGGLFRNWPCR